MYCSSPQNMDLPEADAACSACAGACRHAFGPSPAGLRAGCNIRFAEFKKGACVCHIATRARPSTLQASSGSIPTSFFAPVVSTLSLADLATTERCEKVSELSMDCLGRRVPLLREMNSLQRAPPALYFAPLGQQLRHQRRSKRSCPAAALAEGLGPAALSLTAQTLGGPGFASASSRVTSARATMTLRYSHKTAADPVNLSHRPSVDLGSEINMDVFQPIDICLARPVQPAPGRFGFWHSKSHLGCLGV